jgi:hypothetical protein
MRLLKLITKALRTAFETSQDVDPAAKPMVSGYIVHADGSRQHVSFRLD